MVQSLNFLGNGVGVADMGRSGPLDSLSLLWSFLQILGILGIGFMVNDGLDTSEKD